jgi:hypothetical protein
MSGAAGNNRPDLNHIGVDQEGVASHQRAIGNNEKRLAMHTEPLQENMHTNRAGNLNFAFRVA